MKKKLPVEIEDKPSKKLKLSKTEPNDEHKISKVNKFEKKGASKTVTKLTKKSRNLKDARPENHKTKPNSKDAKSVNKNITEKVEDWNKFKKEKKELRLKRIQARTKDNFNLIQQAKKMGEKLRLRTLKEEDRNIIINKLHSLLKGHYAKIVLAHDTARIVQWLLKYSSNILVHQISEELIPITVNMLQSKYGIYCVKRLLKYGQKDIRTSVIDQMKGHSVKLVTHALSAPVVEYAFSTWATATQKQFLIQEFYGDLYKNSKDPNIKHLRDVFKDNENMKAATLGACKANIKRVLNKSLLDSGIVQSVLYQFLQECSADDRAELISELAAHIVVISNSKDGSRAAMQCIWHGTNKDKKIIIKSLKEHLVNLSKHEFGHCTVITLLDSVDDTVLVHKAILTDILKNATDLAVNEWGRKVLLWLVAPGNSTLFHTSFIKELTEGRESSNSKKSPDLRRQEILNYSISTLLNLVIEDTKFWLSTGSLSIEMLAIIKAGIGSDLQEALSKIVEVITDGNWRIQEGKNEVMGIEHAGIHMTLKKLAQHDKIALENGNVTFGETLLNCLTEDVIGQWLKINRGCFLLVAIFENSPEDVQESLKSKLKPYRKLLKSQNTSGANVLAKKLC